MRLWPLKLFSSDSTPIFISALRVCLLVCLFACLFLLFVYCLSVSTEGRTGEDSGLSSLNIGLISGGGFVALAFGVAAVTSYYQRLLKAVARQRSNSNATTVSFLGKQQLEVIKSPADVPFKGAVFNHRYVKTFSAVDA